MSLLYVFLIFLLGSVIQGIAGFGLAIFAMPLLPFIMPLKTAAVLVVFASFFIAVQVALQLRKHINIKLLVFPVIALLIGRIVGVHVLMSYKESILKVLLGYTLILLSIYFAFYKNKISIKGSNRNGAIAGLISGVTGGIFNIGGPPLSIYYLVATEEKMEYNANLQVTLVFSAVFSIILHFLYGNVNVETLKLSSVGIIGATLGCYIGLAIFKKLNSNMLSKIIYTFMIIMGIIMIIQR
ncbi:sulfite exporter TauE/SafE family protein [Petroclostridium sp. X23]|uniref:sulfite exporter TauE/SafE family protein n=1 Tax=Petroclostridium sp. X23 TaxID=3045146 RepID=UPI0024AD1BFA|nr:sulfite exporter TauE/SafE family protein [Petroclostridium sp. X23]WHH58575.1 sulfite exporter TauE/SafE family protein [Petroclostridium sp. X23]